MARPREFDPREALEKAMLQFWAAGYHDTSIRDLTARTGVNQYGLYSQFENKRGLYLAALDRYRETVTRSVLSRLQEAGPVAQAVEAAFTVLISRMRTADGAVGCMMANAALEVAPQDAGAAAKVDAHMALLRQAFSARLQAADAAGELPPETDTERLAEFFATTAYSLGLLLRAGRDDAYLRRHIKTALAVLE